MKKNTWSIVSTCTRDTWMDTGRSRDHLIRKTAFPKEQEGQSLGKGQRFDDECSTKDGTFIARLVGFGSFTERTVPALCSVLWSPRSEGFLCHPPLPLVCSIC